MAIKLVSIIAVVLSSLSSFAQFREMTPGEVRDRILSEISTLKVTLCDRDIPGNRNQSEIVTQVRKATKAARCDLTKNLEAEMAEVFNLNSSQVINHANLADFLHERYLLVTQKYARDFFAIEKKLADQALQNPDLNKTEKNELFFQFDVAREANFRIMSEKLVLLGEFIRQLDQVKIRQQTSSDQTRDQLSSQSVDRAPQKKISSGVQ